MHSWLARLVVLVAFTLGLSACGASNEEPGGNRAAGGSGATTCQAPSCECADCLSQCLCQTGDQDGCTASCAASSGGASGSGGSGAAGGTGGTAGVGATGGSGGTAGAGATGGAGGAGGTPGGVSAIGANTTVGVEWAESAGATGYRVYWSTTPGVAVGSAQSFDVSKPAFVHRGLTNGTAYYYVVTAVAASGESAASSEVSATPTGEWVLEELGTGLFNDVLTASTVPRVPIEKRVQILLYAEGYMTADLDVFHTVAGHDSTRTNDVDRWVDLVFGIEPYSAFREAFVVWYLPRASTEHIGGATAFAVPIDFSTSFPGVGTIDTAGETAIRAWDALGTLLFPPVAFYSGSSPRTRNHVASFLIFDPARGRASVSGRATTLRNPANTQRLSAAFGVGHAHEFSHAFSQLRDEYMETTNAAPTQWGPTSNVVGTNVCSELPWAHLLLGGAENPGVDQLVGAFGTPEIGFHSELLCLLNGTHDNVQFFGGSSGLLRVEDRFCNFCREVTTYRILERTQVIADDVTGFDTWQQSYRSTFYDQYGFSTPSVIPQTNDLGEPRFTACTP